MSMNTGYVISVFLAMGAVTFALRALPFLCGRWLESHPVVARLGDFLPLAVMTLLVLHSGVGAALEDTAGPWPELAVAALVAGLQWHWRQPMLSILGGMALYLALRNGGV